MRYFSRKLIERTFLKSTASFNSFRSGIKSWSIVFFGSDFYSLFCLRGLHNEMQKNKISNMEVVVINSRTPVYEYSVSNSIKTHLWPPDLNGSYDFGIIVSFGKLVPKSIIEKFPLGILNVHASLLPKYRGGMPIVHAIKNGETVTGVTITKIREDKFDVGEIILQKMCSIDKNEVMPCLHKRLTHLGWECLLEVISDIPKYLDNGCAQSDKDASYAPRLKKEDAIIRWSEMTALEVYNLYRALFSLYELSSTWRGEHVKFACLSLTDSHSHLSVDKGNAEDFEAEPGSFIYSKKSPFLYVQCKDKPIIVCTLKYRNKMYMASSFGRGFLPTVDRTFWKFKS